MIGKVKNCIELCNVLLNKTKNRHYAIICIKKGNLYLHKRLPLPTIKNRF